MRLKLGLSALIVGGLLVAASTASAQRTAGNLRGVISDGATGDTVAGATVVVTGPSLQGAQTFITEGDGLYEITNLPPGTYLVTVYYLDAETRRPNALVQLGKTAVVNIKIKTDADAGEVVVMEGRAPIIDQGSTKQGRTLTPEFTENVPTGQTFGGVLGSAAGSQGDIYGISFGGSTSAENTYIVEGINTTDPAYGLQSTNLPNEFIQETEVITGGYNAEYGRSTGAVVNVVTKTGSNEFHGSVFSYFTPGSFTADEVETPSAGSSINTIGELDYTWNLGAEIGGPIVKDKLWFHVGVRPTFSQTSVHRLINRQVNDGNGSAVVDANGFTVFEEVDRYTREIGGRGPLNLSTTYFTAKLTGAVSPDHQGSISFFGNPAATKTLTGATGIPDAAELEVDTGAWDVSAKWTSKLLDNKIQVDAVAGFHRNILNYATSSGDNSFGDDPQIRIDTTTSIETYAAQEGQYFNGIPEECVDDDPTDGFLPCPARFYNTAGLGFHEQQTTDRLTGLLTATGRVKLAGQHTIKAGLDFENQVYDHVSQYSGGTRYIFRTFGLWMVDKYYSRGMAAAGTNEVDAMCDINGDGMTEQCAFLPDGIPAVTQTNNLGAFLQDSWSILPNLTVNAGLRWERQKLLVSDQLKDDAAACVDAANADGIEGSHLLCPDDEAFTIGNMFAPRLGIIYDPTQEGRSKINFHWGRFYESIPMDINSRAFGGELTNRRYLRNCPDTTPGAEDCDYDNPDNTVVDFFFGGGEEGVVPGLQGQYLDEYVIGGEYELLNDFKVSGNFIHRSLGRVIEDISTDGGNTYLIANPGEINEDALADYTADQQELVDLGLISQEEMDNNISIREASKEFDDPVREYNAIQLRAQKRFTRDFGIEASYTYSKTEGNFPGLFSPETGQLDPNLTSMYDLAELMANRTGPLAADRPHLFKLDGFYRLDLDEIGMFVFGSSVRATSGIPHNVLGSHALYGSGETYILPRGAYTRSPLTTRFDVQLQYQRRLSKNMIVSGFVRVFNLFNQQPPTDISEIYTFDQVNPCVGCTQEDLMHVKPINPENETVDMNSSLDVNPNFGNTNSRQGPRSVTLGARLNF